MTTKGEKKVSNCCAAPMRYIDEFLCCSSCGKSCSPVSFTPTDKSGWEEKLETIAKELSECSDVMPTTLKEHQNKIWNACLDMIHYFKSLSDTQGYERGKKDEMERPYKFPEWITEDMKRNFFEMWDCFSRSAVDYYKDNATELNGKVCKARKVMTDEEVEGVYFHKWNNIGWIYQDGIVHTIANAALSQVRDTINRKLQK